MSRIKIENIDLEIPTYTWSDGDPETALLREFTPRNQPIYPYTTQEKISEKAVCRKYRAIILENEYLRVTFLPELNGRIYSAYDKINNSEMFYNNPVIKPCLFGLRGAWAAVGVEYNFPNSHSTSTMEEIPCFVRQNNDNSVSFICGNVERVSRMSWSVEVKLSPGIARLEMTSRLYNGTDFPHRFYYWVNAAVPTYPKTQYVFPPHTKRLCTHPPMDVSSLAYVEYPIHKGINISIYENINRHFPIFCDTLKEDFFGVFHHDHKHGLVHVADHSLVKGRKIWTFGNARDGKIWMDSLTENGIDYCEVQSGPFKLQSDYRMLQPGYCHTQQDIWYPVGDIGGFNAANQDIAANIQIIKNEITISLNAVKEIDDLVVNVYAGNSNKLASIKGSLVPLKAWTKKINIPENVNADNIAVSVSNADGKILLEYKNGDAQHDLQPSKEVAQNELENTSYSQACYWEEQGFPQKALDVYRNDLGNTLSRISAARIIAQSGNYDKALAELNNILIDDPGNLQANYYAGICLQRLERFAEAEKCFLCCVQDDIPEASAAVRHLAEIYVIQHKYEKAVQQISNAKNYLQTDIQIKGLYAHALRKSGEIQKAIQILETGSREFSMEPLIWGELYFGEKQSSRDSENTNCTDSQLRLETATRYIRINAWQDAYEILENNCSEVKVNPLELYYKGWLLSKMGKADKAKECFIKASQIQSDNDLPFRHETVSVLQEALNNFSDDYTACYLLGNLYASRNDWEHANKCWLKTKGKYQSLAYRGLGLYWWKFLGDHKQAVKYYGLAVQLPNCGSKTLWEYDKLLEQMENHAKRLSNFEQHNQKVLSDNRLLLRKASAHLMAGDPVESLKILLSQKFCLCEGAVLPRLLYEEAFCDLAEAAQLSGDFNKAIEHYQQLLDYPENLGVGKPAANRECEWWWRCGQLYLQMDNNSEARICFENGSTDGNVIGLDFFPLRNVVPQHEADNVDVQYWINEIFKAMCCRELQDVNRLNITGSNISEFLEQKKNEGRETEDEIVLLLALNCLLIDDNASIEQFIHHISPRKIIYNRMIRTLESSVGQLSL